MENLSGYGNETCANSCRFVTMLTEYLRSIVNGALHEQREVLKDHRALRGKQKRVKLRMACIAPLTAYCHVVWQMCTDIPEGHASLHHHCSVHENISIDLLDYMTPCMRRQ
jgi:hypothetical protein